MTPRLGTDGNIAHVMSCMLDLSAISLLIDTELSVRGDSLWEESMLLDLRLNPVAHRLLDIPPASGGSLQHCAISEALRQGALLWVIWIKRRYHAYPGSPTAMVQGLLGLLTQRPDWTDVLADIDLLSVELWLLVLCGISCDGSVASPSPVDVIALRMRQMGWSGWGEVMMRVGQMPWTRTFDGAVAQLAGRVENINLLSMS